MVDLSSQAWDIARRRFTDAEPLYVAAQANLAEALRMCGRYEESSSLFADAAETSRNIFGPDDPNRMHILNNYAQLCSTTGRTAEAAALFEEVSEIYRLMVGDEHPDYASTLANWAKALSTLGETERAEQLYTRALDIHERNLGVHALTSFSAYGLGQVKLDAGRPGEAAPHLERALDVACQTMGGEHYFVAQILGRLAQVHLALGDDAEAESAALEGLRIGAAHWTSDHPMMRQLGQLLDQSRASQGAAQPSGAALQSPARQFQLRDNITFVGHVENVFAVAFSPDGSMLASGSFGNAIPVDQPELSLKLWDVHGPKKVAETEYGPMAVGSEIDRIRAELHGVLDVAFSPDGKLLAVGSTLSGENLQVFDVASGRLVHKLEGHGMMVTSLTFSPSGATLASGDNSGAVFLWNVDDGRNTLSCAFDDGGPQAAMGEGENLYLQQSWAEVCSLAFSPDGTLLAAGLVSGDVLLLDAATLELAADLRGHADQAYSVAFSPDGRLLASGSFDCSIRLWDVATRRLAKVLPGRADRHQGAATMTHDSVAGPGERAGHSGQIGDIAFSPDGQVLASGATDTALKLWDVASGQVLVTVIPHTSTISSVAFSPNGDAIATGSYDRTVNVSRFAWG